MTNPNSDPLKDAKPPQTILTIVDIHRWDYSCPNCDQNIHNETYKGLYDQWSAEWTIGNHQDTIQLTCPRCGVHLQAAVLITPEFGFRLDPAQPEESAP